MNAINHYINPLSDHFRQSIEDFRSLSLCKKIAAVAAAVFGTIATFYLLGIGGVATFQLAVKWLRTSDKTVQTASTSTETHTKPIQTRDKKVSKLREMLDLSLEQMKRNAIEEGFTEVTLNDLLSRFTGQGWSYDDDFFTQGEYRDGNLIGKVTSYKLNELNACLTVYQGSTNTIGQQNGIEVGKEHWYEGEFQREGTYVMRHGKGTLRDEGRRMTYSGKFNNDRHEGEAKIIWDSGERFKGTASLISHSPNEFRGDGTFISKTGEIFEGKITISSDRDEVNFSGRGTHRRPDGSEETGQIVNWEKLD